MGGDKSVYPIGWMNVKVKYRSPQGKQASDYRKDGLLFQAGQLKLEGEQALPFFVGIAGNKCQH